MGRPTGSEHDTEASREIRRRARRTTEDGLTLHGDARDPAEVGLRDSKARDDHGPDVMFHVPELKVEEIDLDVQELQARVSLHARVGNLVTLGVGAEVDIDQVKLAIKGVDAEALLKVRLEHVHSIVARALETVCERPEVVERTVEPLENGFRRLGRSISGSFRYFGERVKETIADPSTAGRKVRGFVESIQRGFEEGGDQRDEASEASARGETPQQHSASFQPCEEWVDEKPDFSSATNEQTGQERSLGRAALGSAKNVVQMFGRTVRNAADSLGRPRRGHTEAS